MRLLAALPLEMYAATAAATEFDAYNFARRSVRPPVRLFLREIFNEYLITISPGEEKRRRRLRHFRTDGRTDDGKEEGAAAADDALLDATIKLGSFDSGGQFVGGLDAKRQLQSPSICPLTFHFGPRAFTPCRDPREVLAFPHPFSATPLFYSLKVARCGENMR